MLTGTPVLYPMQAMSSPLYSKLRTILQDHGLQDQGPASASVITFPEELPEEERKERKRNELLANPESLFAAYRLIRYRKREEERRAKTNLVFHTHHPGVWHSTVCGVFPHTEKKHIDYGRQVKVSEQPDSERPELTINVYDNGTVMVQGGERHLDQFQNNFLSLKKVVEQRLSAQ